MKTIHVIKMAVALGGRIFLCFSNCCGIRNGKFAIPLGVGMSDVLQVRNYAARKGTREKARKKKVKVEVKKPAFVPWKKKTAVHIARRIGDDMKPDPVDNVWYSRHYKWPVYSFADAVQCHRETHHPTVYNSPDAELYVNIELDVRAAKANRYLDEFTRIVSVPHPLQTDSPRSVLVFCKSAELQRSAFEAGATIAGATELIRNVQSGELNLQDFQYVVAHPDILPELISVRGLMKKKFPSQKSGTLGVDIRGIVSRFCTGIEYTAKVDKNLKDYGWIFTSVGKLDMDTSHLEENFSALLKDVNSMRPDREGPFITKCCLVALPSPERLKVDYIQYIDEDDNKKEEEHDDVEEEENETDKSELEKTSAVVG